MRDVARWLLAYDEAQPNPSEANLPAAYRVSEKLRRPLSTLAGDAGFHSLLARALTLAKREVPNLSSVKVMPDGSLEGLSELDGEAAESGVILIAHLLELLATFVGASLVLRLVHDLWPDLPSGGTDSGEA